MKIGRVISVALAAMVFLLFIALDLVFLGLIPLNSALVIILPVIGLLLGGVAGGLGSRARQPIPSN